ncbi:DUF3667 domain-containing protein [Chryseobacterium sp. MYb264]|uniref:DUF3667 domain-containing protein n=1 Tax=Chryseobacterium sp. MYb264 TaxID=2745153 RepID=UPI002E14F5B6|nr:DUF3667 domain-containing protein [Chryseobacterium sp. MYb264]
MENICLNCNEIITANFCGNCGQKKYKRINRKYVIDEVQYTFLHTNKGFLYSVKKILKNPGKTAKDFIDGNRVNHYKPILLAFLLSGISAFLSYKVIHFEKVLKLFYEKYTPNSSILTDLMATMNSYNSIFMLLLVPFFALLSKTVFMKWGQNYYEHVVMNAFVLSYYNILNIIFVYPILYFIRDDIQLFAIFTTLVLFVGSFFMLIWFYKGFYSERSWKTIILRVIGIFGLIVVAYFIMLILIVIGLSIYAYIKGPEAVQYLLPKK